MTRLKQLNTHLEGRLSDQEKRLVLVSNELSKTWNFVSTYFSQNFKILINDFNFKGRKNAKTTSTTTHSRKDITL